MGDRGWEDIMNKIDEYKDKMNWDMWEDVSPCVGICTLNENDICIGCDRHIDEIMECGRNLHK